MEAAEKRANELADSLPSEIKPFTPEQIRTVHHAVEVLAPTDISLSQAARAVAEANEILGGLGTIQEAARLLVEQRRKQHLPKITVAQLYQEYMKELVTEENGKRTFLCSFRYWQDNTSRLRAFVDYFGHRQIAEISTRELEAFFNAFPVRKARGKMVEDTGKKRRLTGRTRNNYKGIYCTFFKFAKDRGYLPRGIETEAQHIHKAHDNKTQQARAEELPSRIYRPAEMQIILDQLPMSWVTFVALGAYAGIRTTELHRLDWRDINLKEKVIEVDKHKAKVGSRRVIPISAQLAAWLKPHARKSGWICPHFGRESSLLRAFGKARNSIPVRKVHNGFRHSYASYRMAEIGDKAKVAWEMNTSPQKLESNYISLAFKSDLALWKMVLPKRKKN
jgi:integrase